MLIMFTDNCTAWTDDKDYNKKFIDHTIHYLNTKMQEIGWVSLNDLYDSLGKDRELSAQMFGWDASRGQYGLIEFEFIDINDGTNNVIINLKNMVKLL